LRSGTRTRSGITPTRHTLTLLMVVYVSKCHAYAVSFLASGITTITFLTYRQTLLRLKVQLMTLEVI